LAALGDSCSRNDTREIMQAVEDVSLRRGRISFDAAMCTIGMQRGHFIKTHAGTLHTNSKHHQCCHNPFALQLADKRIMVRTIDAPSVIRASAFTLNLWVFGETNRQNFQKKRVAIDHRGLVIASWQGLPVLLEIKFNFYFSLIACRVNASDVV